jgi:hypothetical protein
MKSKWLNLLATTLCAATLTTGGTAQAALLGADNATNPAYQADDSNGANDTDPTNNTNGWQTGDNGGTGFGAWTLTSSGGGGSYIGSTGLGATTFGLFAGGDQASDLSSADRPFTGALSAGQTFSIDLGHSSSIATGGEVGVQLLDNGTPVITLKFVGGGTDWQFNDGGSDFGIAQGYAANTALTFAFTYNGGSSYDYSFGSASGDDFNANVTISNINGVRLFSNKQGGGENAGFNNITIIPEPATLVTLIGGLGLLVLRRRR